MVGTRVSECNVTGSPTLRCRILEIKCAGWACAVLSDGVSLNEGAGGKMSSWDVREKPTAFRFLDRLMVVYHHRGGVAWEHHQLR